MLAESDLAVHREVWPPRFGRERSLSLFSSQLSLRPCLGSSCGGFFFVWAPPVRDYPAPFTGQHWAVFFTSSHHTTTRRAAVRNMRDISTAKLARSRDIRI
jgi:hypothetical protein